MWFKEYTLSEVNSILNKYMTAHLDIRVTKILTDGLVATMPISDLVRQPFGILHGGASVVLAESLGSIASNLIVDPQQHAGVGLEINANHLKSVKSGYVTAICSAIRIGRTTHVWDIKIYDDQDNLICISRHTVAIISQSSAAFK